MATTEENDIPRAVKLLGIFWPIGLVIAGFGVTSVRVDGQVQSVDARVTEVEKNGPAVIRERLARIETMQQVQSRQLTRMEDTLDSLDKRSRDHNLNGL